MLSTHNLAATSQGELVGILCLLLLIAACITIVIGIVEALGVRRFTGNRYGALILGVILLVIYVIVC